MNDLEKKLEVAIETARMAGDFALKKRNEGNFSVYNKHLNDFVTDVDRETEKVIFSSIKEAFPKDGFYGEESGISGGQGRWIVDPIDGTTNFFRGLPDWAVSIAYEKEKFKPLIGVVYIPCRNEMYFALKGKGTFLNDKKVECSSIDDLGNALIVCVPPHRHKENYDNYSSIMKKIGNYCSDIRSYGTCAQEMAYIASGVLEGYYELKLGYYDFAAGQVLVEEAGGCVSNASKTEPFTDTSCAIIVSNSLLHSNIEEFVFGK